MLKCENCAKTFVPLVEDQQRIDTAIINGTKFLVLKCTECFKHTSWRADDLVNESKENSNAQKDLIKSLPPNYVEYISKFDKYHEFKVYRDEDEFQIYSKQKLEEKINIDGNQYARINQIEGYLRTLKELSIMENEKEIALLDNAVSIGFENTRILFVDGRKENSFLYIFHPDGGDVEKTNIRVDEIIV